MTATAAPLPRAALTALLDRYGGDPASWPEAERAAALARIACDPEAARDVAAARRLDAVLGERAAPAVPSAELRARLAAIPGDEARRRAPARSPARAGGRGRRTAAGWRTAGRPAAVAAGLAASLLLGLVVGLATAPPPAAGPGADDIDLVALMYGRSPIPEVRL